MKKNSLCGAAVLGLALVSGCGSISYIKDELSGSSKPEGGIAETVPPSKTYASDPQALRHAVLAVLSDQGYIAEELVNGSIRTEPKVLGDPTKFAFAGASYSAKLTLRLEGSTVTYRARFDKKSNITQGEQNIEYPEKENELRKAFFAALDKRLAR